MTKTGTILSAWIFQGFLYMNKYEKMYKITIEILIFSLFLFVLPLVGMLTLSATLVFLSLLFAHTFTWLFNGQVITMFIHMEVIHNSPDKFIKYTNMLTNRIRAKKYIGGAAVFGALTMYNFRKSSDLDLRLVMRPGFLNRLLVCQFCFIERLRAFFLLFPIDIFAFELEELRGKMSTDEDPVIIYDPEEQLRSVYPRGFGYEEFYKEFKRRFA